MGMLYWSSLLLEKETGQLRRELTQTRAELQRMKSEMRRPVVVQVEEAAPCRPVTAAPQRHAIKDPFAVAKSSQYAGVTELLQVLRDAGLAQSCYFRQLGNAAFALPAQRDQPHAYRVCKGFKLPCKFFNLTCHKYIKISLYYKPNSVAR